MERLGNFFGGIYNAGDEGAARILAVLGFFALLVTIRTFLGLDGFFGIFVPLVLVLAAGLVDIEIRRIFRIRSLRKLAILVRHPAGTPLDPHDDAGVRPWLGGGPSRDLSPFVERRAMQDVEKGLRESRFVILVGEESSGKSRLAYEAACSTSEVTLVARPLPDQHSLIQDGDPLASLMDERGGLPAVEDHQVLLLNDFARRIRNGWLSASRVRDWLEHNPNLSILAILETSEREEIIKLATPSNNSWVRLTEEAEVIRVRSRLDGKEKREAAQKYPYLDRGQIPELTRYLASGPPLREALGEIGTDPHAIGSTIVAAVADWRRAGLSRPAPLAVVREVVGMRHEDVDAEQFEEELEWALEHRRADSALIYEIPVGEGRGFVPHLIVVELFEHGELSRSISSDTWWTFLSHVSERTGAGDTTDSELAWELTALAQAALRRGNEDLAYEAFERAAELSDLDQQQEIGEIVVTGKEVPLVTSRRGDGIFHRLKPIKALAEGRRFEAENAAVSREEGWRKAFSWIYSRHTSRSAARLLVLGLADLSSTGLGLLVGLWLRHLLTEGGGGLDSAGSVSGSFVGVWIALTIFVFATARLYKKDAARCRMGAIGGAALGVASFGFIAATTDGTDPLIALAAAVAGGLTAFLVDLGLRFAYDKVSRNWVGKHGLEARTLLIGPAAQVATVERALKAISRPTVVVGYLSSGVNRNPDASPASPWLGTPKNLAAVAQQYGVGRVILTDPKLNPTDRQRLADKCHERGLLVEARASLLDIRVGSASFVLGQPLVLMQLMPLWQRNVWFFLKRMVDIVFASLGLLFLGIPLLAVWLLLIMQERPGMVRTLRSGVGGEAFFMLRFRTAKDERGTRIDLVEDQGKEGVERTRLGSFLRNHGIDELPQLINVLLGHMSLVGPRPLELRHHVQLSDMELQRYVVRPGATGPWQVCRQTALTTSELTSIDFAYLRKWSLLTDLEILVRTGWLVVRRKQVPTLVA